MKPQQLPNPVCRHCTWILRALSLACCFFSLAIPTLAEAPVLDDDIPLIRRPWTNDSDKFSFVILGDKTSGGEGKWPIYDRAVDTINLLAPDFVVTVGDMIPGHMEDRPTWDAEWAEYTAHAKRIEAPLFFTPGNHDLANLACFKYWQEDFGRTYYSFDYKDCHFLVLNSEEERFDGRGPVWQRMMTWMEKDLSGTTNTRHTFVLFHKPMWDDPRFLDDWVRIERALGKRRFTVVAGHEHYHSVEQRNGNYYVVQSATGGGIGLSEVKAWGGFHSFGFVTMDGDAMRYAVVEPEGGIWPVDVAPTAFRKAITHELVTIDARPGTDFSRATATLHNQVVLRNVLDKKVTVRAVIERLGQAGWQAVLDKESPWLLKDGAIILEQDLAVGEQKTIPLSFVMPTANAAFPPALEWSVCYGGGWLKKEAMRMVEINTVPLYPVETIKAPKEIFLAGPFPLGPIDTQMLPDNPSAANAHFYQRFGPEDGLDLDRVYGDGIRWVKHKTQGQGLINANALVGTIDHAAAYALCHVFSPKPQRTHAIVYADNFSQTYLNGVLIEEAQDFGAPGGFVYPPLDLKKGWNTVVVKLINNRADWFLRFLIADPNNTLVLRAGSSRAHRENMPSSRSRH